MNVVANFKLIDLQALHIDNLTGDNKMISAEIDFFYGANNRGRCCDETFGNSFRRA